MNKWEKMTDTAAVYILNAPDEALKDVSPDRVAAEVGIEKDLLYGAFKRTLHISLADFIKREKLYRAFFVLETDGRVEIDELARRLGFAGKEGFEKEFEAFFLIAPLRYRELVKKREHQNGIDLPDHICASH